MKNIFLSFLIGLLSVSLQGQLKVFTNGDTKVGTTGTPNIANTKLDVHGAFFVRGIATIPNTGFVINSTNSEGPWFGAHTDGNGLSTANFIASRFRPGAAGVFIETSPATTAGNLRTWTTRMNITPQGAVGIGKYPVNAPGNLDVAGSIYHNGLLIYSDKRLKKNVEKYSRGLEVVKQLNPISYNYNGKAGTNTNGTHIGLFAQELQKYAPELVSIVKSETVTHDINGTEVIDSEEYLAVHDDEIKYLLITAIKDQQNIIDNQETRISQLEELVQKFVYTDSRNVLEVDLEETQFAHLGQNNPNPFDATTSIEYSIPTEFTSAQLEIFNLNGQIIKSVELKNAGKGQIYLNSLNLTGGQYSYSLIVDGKLIDSKKMMIVK